jgi:hypothetical protein
MFVWRPEGLEGHQGSMKGKKAKQPDMINRPERSLGAVLYDR